MMSSSYAYSVMAQQMKRVLSDLIERLAGPALSATNVIPWSCPVPSFGDFSKSVIATLGLNPSKREFVDGLGNELDGPSRRLQTLKSLGLARWSDANARHLELIMRSCRGYFYQNPYDGWFRDLDGIISGANVSYYDGAAKACHLDLIPYATACKWTELSPKQRSALLTLAGDTLGHLLRDSPIRVLILNGMSVVENLQRIAGVSLEKKEMPDWTLPRRSGVGVVGIAYRGVVRELSGVKLKRPVLVLGFNHNIQSSFGVTTNVKVSIRHWIAHASKEVTS